MDPGISAGGEGVGTRRRVPDGEGDGSEVLGKLKHGWSLGRRRIKLKRSWVVVRGTENMKVRNY